MSEPLGVTDGRCNWCGVHIKSYEELLAIVKEIYSDENDLCRRKHSDEMRFRMEEAIAKAEGKS